jgi:hypothetical protein
VIMVTTKAEITAAMVVIGNGAGARQKKGENRDESQSFGQTH